MNEAGGRQRMRKAQRSEEPLEAEASVEQEIIIYRRVSRFIDGNLQPNVRRLAIEKIETLKDPTRRRGSVKIRDLYT